jgi:hypothetical protein
MELTHDEITKYIKQIETSTSDEDVKMGLKKLKYVTNQAQYKLTQAINSNDTELKSTILNNTENIIKMFNNIKEIKEDFSKSKRGVDSILSQMLM